MTDIGQKDVQNGQSPKISIYIAVAIAGLS